MVTPLFSLEKTNVTQRIIVSINTSVTEHNTIHAKQTLQSSTQKVTVLFPQYMGHTLQNLQKYP